VVEKASTSDVIAFRLNAHNLSERVRENALLKAAGQCGVQNSPPGSALLMTLVEFGGRACILTEDLGALRSSQMSKRVRLLPARDPYTQMRDRETIVDKRYHREVWKSVGESGALMANGKITGIWRPRKSGRTLAMIVKTFSSLREKERKSIQDEAEKVAVLRGAASVGVEFDTY
jgi:hypothetical protein